MHSLLCTSDFSCVKFGNFLKQLSSVLTAGKFDVIGRNREHRNAIVVYPNSTSVSIDEFWEVSQNWGFPVIYSSYSGCVAFLAPDFLLKFIRSGWRAKHWRGGLLDDHCLWIESLCLHKESDFFRLSSIMIPWRGCPNLIFMNEILKEKGFGIQMRQPGDWKMSWYDNTTAWEMYKWRQIIVLLALGYVIDLVGT